MHGYAAIYVASSNASVYARVWAHMYMYAYTYNGVPTHMHTKYVCVCVCVCSNIYGECNSVCMCVHVGAAT